MRIYTYIVAISQRNKCLPGCGIDLFDSFVFKSFD